MPKPIGSKPSTTKTRVFQCACGLQLGLFTHTHTFKHSHTSTRLVSVA